MSIRCSHIFKLFNSATIINIYVKKFWFYSVLLRTKHNTGAYKMHDTGYSACVYFKGASLTANNNVIPHCPLRQRAP